MLKVRLFYFLQAEFRRLTDQIRDVNWNLSSKFKGFGFNVSFVVCVVRLQRVVMFKFVCFFFKLPFDVR